MLRALLYGLAILHLGPGLAFVLLAFGCDGASPVLGALCGGRVLSSFALLTASVWLFLILGLAAWHLLRKAKAASGVGTLLRAWALLALLAAAAVVAAFAYWLSGSQYSFLALPIAVGLGWVYLANPEACLPGAPAEGGSSGNHESAA